MVDKNDNTFSTENIRIVRELYSAFQKSDINAILAILHPDVEWGEPANPFNPAAGTRYGHAGFLEWLEIGRQSEEILTLEPQQYLGNSDTVAVVGYTRCRARSTGKIYETDFVHLITFKEGKIIRFREFFDTFIAAEAFRSDAG
jgi:ketosteroid isomerase-like protein